MKKNSLIVIVLILLTVSMVVNYKLNNKVKTSISFIKTLEVELQVSHLDNEALELRVSTLAEDISLIEKQLQSKIKTISLIDEKLEADGKILKRVDELLTENDIFRKDLKAVFLELNILEEINSKQTDGVIITMSQLEQWDTDIQVILELLEARIAVLREGTSNLSTFSIERVMVNTEINFLESTYSDIEQLKEEMLSDVRES